MRLYFDNIANNELLNYHKVNITNFSISLTDILDSGLFYSETIVSDSLYRIFPLFYCESITSNNSEDKILENKCIIALKGEDETYYTFITDESLPVQDYISFGDYYSVGDSLTVNQYNSIVQILLDNVIFTDDVRFKLVEGLEDSYKGKYADYHFITSELNILDTGVLITEDLSITIILNDVLLNDFDYTLHYKIMDITDINIEETDNNNNITITEKTLQLTKNQTGTTLTFENTDYEKILLLDASIEIRASTILQGSWVNNIEVSATRNPLQTGETSVISAKVTDINNIGVPNKVVNFYEVFDEAIRLTGDKSIIQTGEKVSLTAQLYDESDGSLIRWSGETINFYELYEGLNIYSDVTRISVSDSRYPDRAEITVLASDENEEPMANQVVEILVDGVVAYDGVTDTDGLLSYTLLASDAGTVTVSARNLGTGEVSLNSLTITDNSYTSKTVTATFIDNDNAYGNRPSSVSVNLLANGEIVRTGTVSESNNWSYTFTEVLIITGVTYSISVGSVDYYTSTVNGFNITLTEATPTVTLTVGKVWVDNDDAYGLRPSSLVLSLNSGETVTVSEATSWQGSITVPQYRNKTAYTYDWSEEAITKYSMTSKETIDNETIITNTYNERV